MHFLFHFEPVRIYILFRNEANWLEMLEGRFSSNCILFICRYLTDMKISKLTEEELNKLRNKLRNGIRNRIRNKLRILIGDSWVMHANLPISIQVSMTNWSSVTTSSIYEQLPFVSR